MEFEADFNLMVDNCLAYNRKDTMFYRAGVKMREQCSPIIQQTRKDYPEFDIPFNERHLIETKVKDEDEEEEEVGHKENRSAINTSVTSGLKGRKKEKSARVRNDSETRNR